MKREPKNPNRIINISDRERRPAQQAPTRRPAQQAPARNPSKVSIENTRRSVHPEHIREKEQKPRKVLIPVIIGLIVIAIAVFVVIFLNKRNYPVNTAAYGISDEARLEAASNSQVLNVVFLGVDHEENRSDVMMVVSVNKSLKTVNVTSLLRDTRVEYEEHAPTKLGYAYKWGGTDLTLKTINTSYNTAFDRYICMTFEDLIDIVDAVGGVDIELTSTEAELVNDLARETGYMEWSAVPGWNTLNGDQALGYARIRKIDSEYARAGRQQVVIQALIRKIKSMSVFSYPAVLSKVLGNLKTNLSYGELISIALVGIKSDMVQHTLPDANYEEGLFGGWVLNPDGGPEEDPVQWLWIYDLEAAGYRLKRIMYDPSYWEDPNLPFTPWIWNELEDVIAGLDIDVSDINVDDEIIYVEPDTAPNEETQESQTESRSEEITTPEETTSFEEPTTPEETTSIEESSSEEMTTDPEIDSSETPEETSEEQSDPESGADDGEDTSGED